MGQTGACASRYSQEHASDAANGIALPRHGSHFTFGADGRRRLHYCDWGNPDNARVVVCLHGLVRSARDFDALARELATDFRVICPDLPGRAEAEWLAAATVHDVGQMLADLDALLAGLDVGTVDLIGTSMGGELGMRLALRPSAPVRRLYVTDAAAFPRAPSTREISAIRTFLGQRGPVLCAPQRFLRAGACSSASTRRSTRIGLVR